MKSWGLVLAAGAWMVFALAGCGDRDARFQEHFDAGMAALQAADGPENLQAAADLFTRALSVKPDNPQALFHRGKAYFKRADLEKALPDFERAAVLDPGMAQAYFHRALCLIGLKSPDRQAIIQDLEKAVEIDPGIQTAKNLLLVLKTPPPARQPTE